MVEGAGASVGASTSSASILSSTTLNESTVWEAGTEVLVMNGIAKQVLTSLRFSLARLEEATQVTDLQRLVTNLHSQADDLVTNIVLDLKNQRPSVSHFTLDAMAADLNAINLPLLWQSVDTLCQSFGDELLKPLLRQMNVVDNLIDRSRLAKGFAIPESSIVWYSNALSHFKYQTDTLRVLQVAIEFGIIHHESLSSESAEIREVATQRASICMAKLQSLFTHLKSERRPVAG